MSIMFCPQCGSLLQPAGTNTLKCPRCGYTKSVEKPGGIVIASTKIKHGSNEKILMIEDSRPKSTLPRTRDTRCPKCGNDEAEYWFIQTRRADEPPTRFYRCVKCGHVWREYE